MRFRLFIALAVLIFSCNCAWARDAFLLELTVENVSSTAGFKKIEDLVEALDNEGLSRIIDSYTPTLDAVAVLDLRGLNGSNNVIVSYARNSTFLIFEVKSLRIREEFRGDTRDESEDLFKEWLKGQGGDILTRLLKELVKESPIDPVAGNPVSLIGLMTAADFDMGTNLVTGELEISAGDKKPNHICLAARFGRYTAADFGTNVYTLPLSYSITLSDPRKTIIIDAPFTYVNSNGSEAYNCSLGLGLRLDLMRSSKAKESVVNRKGRSWHLTPAIRMGIVSSRDLGSSAWVYSGSAISNYNFYIGDLIISIGNMLGAHKTGSVEISGYDIDYDLTNYVLRNGISLESSLNYRLFGSPTTWQFSVVDTRFFGDDLFIERYNDIALSFGTRHEPGSPIWKTMRLGVTATLGENGYQGWRANFGYRF